MKNKESSMALELRIDKEHKGYIIGVCPACHKTIIQYTSPCPYTYGEELGYCKQCGQKVHIGGN